MSSNEETHPVYIAKDRKTRVKTLAAQNESSMKGITERFAEHGDTLGLYKIPVDADKEELFAHIADEFQDELSSAN